MANDFEKLEDTGTLVDLLVNRLKSAIEGKGTRDCVLMTVPVAKRVLSLLEELNEIKKKSECKTLEGSIRHLRDLLSDPTKDWGCDDCRKDHELLYEFLKELRAYRATGMNAEEINNLSENNFKEFERLREMFRRQENELTKLRGVLDEKTSSGKE
jgi:hypothetical protein